MPRWEATLTSPVADFAVLAQEDCRFRGISLADVITEGSLPVGRV